MKNKFELNLPRGLALAFVVLSLASVSGFALTNVTQTNPAISSASPAAPAWQKPSPPLKRTL